MKEKPLSLNPFSRFEKPALQNAEMEWKIEKKVWSKKESKLPEERLEKIKTAPRPSIIRVKRIILFKVLKTSPRVLVELMSFSINWVS